MSDPTVPIRPDSKCLTVVLELQPDSTDQAIESVQRLIQAMLEGYAVSGLEGYQVRDVAIGNNTDELHRALRALSPLKDPNRREIHHEPE